MVITRSPCILYDSTFTNPIATVAALQPRRGLRLGGMLHERHREPQPVYANQYDGNDLDGDPTDGIYGSHSGITCGLARPASASFGRNSNTVSRPSVTD